MPEFLCNATKSLGYRKTRVGTRRPSLTQGPHALSQMFNTSSDWPSQEICLKNSILIWPGRSQKESFHAQHRCPISTSGYRERHTWVDFFIHSQKHSLNIYWRNCSGEALTKDRRPTLKEIKESIKNKIHSTNTLLFQVWSIHQQHQHHPEACWECSISGPSSRTPESESACLTRAQKIHRNIRNWEAFTYPSRRWTPTF